MSQGAAVGRRLLLWLQTTHFADQNSAHLPRERSADDGLLAIRSCWPSGAAISTSPLAGGLLRTRGRRLQTFVPVFFLLRQFRRGKKYHKIS